MKQWLYKLPAGLYAVLIFIGSSFEKEQLPPFKLFSLDKLLHSIEYLIFGLLLMLAFVTSASEKVRRKAISISLIIGICYAASDEIHQLFVRGRSGSIVDLLFDALGLGLGIWFYYRFILNRYPEIFS